VLANARQSQLATIMQIFMVDSFCALVAYRTQVISPGAVFIVRSGSAPRL